MRFDVKVAHASVLRALQTHRAERFTRCGRCGGSGEIPTTSCDRARGPAFDGCPCCGGLGEVFATDYALDLAATGARPSAGAFRAMASLGLRVVAAVSPIAADVDPVGASMPWERSFDATTDSLAEVA